MVSNMMSSQLITYTLVVHILSWRVINISDACKFSEAINEFKITLFVLSFKSLLSD